MKTPQPRWRPRTQDRDAPGPSTSPEAEAKVAAPKPAPAAHKLAENIERIETLGHRLMAALADRNLPNPGVEGRVPSCT